MDRIKKKLTNGDGLNYDDRMTLVCLIEKHNASSKMNARTTTLAHKYPQGVTIEDCRKADQ